MRLFNTIHYTQQNKLVLICNLHGILQDCDMTWRIVDGSWKVPDSRLLAMISKASTLKILHHHRINWILLYLLHIVNGKPTETKQNDGQVGNSASRKKPLKKSKICSYPKNWCSVQPPARTYSNKERKKEIFTNLRKFLRIRWIRNKR